MNKVSNVTQKKRRLTFGNDFSFLTFWRWNERRGKITQVDIRSHETSKSRWRNKSKGWKRVTRNKLLHPFFKERKNGENVYEHHLFLFHCDERWLFQHGSHLSWSILSLSFTPFSHHSSSRKGFCTLFFLPSLPLRLTLCWHFSRNDLHILIEFPLSPNILINKKNSSKKFHVCHSVLLGS